MSEKKPRLLAKLTAMLMVTALTLGLIAFVGQFIKIGEQTMNQVLVTQLIGIKNKVFGGGSMGIHQAEPVLGWAHKPNSTGKHWKPFGFDVRYNIDEYGHRRTTGSYASPKILVLGCSFAFGHGVEDGEVFPAILQAQFPDYKVVNCAAMGYGTLQAYLSLRDQLQRWPDVRAVVYAYIPHHLHRNYLRKYWLELLNESGRQNPHLEIQGDSLCWLPLADPKTDGLADESILAEKELRITQTLIAEMSAMCARDSIPFLVVHIPDGTDLHREGVFAKLPATELLDLSKVMDFSKMENGVDKHPNAAAHAEIGELVGKKLARTIVAY